MTEKPILFSGPMVRAILDGRKTQTRRVFKFVETGLPPACPDKLRPEAVTQRCPYGAVGDRLWVRETFGLSHTSGGNQVVAFRADMQAFKKHSMTNEKIWMPCDDNQPDECWKWKPSIFMPRWASRLTLEITGVRVERLQEITEADAIAEGVSPAMHGDYAGWCGDGKKLQFVATLAFRDLWDSINGNRKDKHGNRMPYGWADSPWVWVIEFRRINQKEAK